MPGYETLEVLYKMTDETGRLPVEVSVEKQCRVRDDESKTRPFIKMLLVVGNRTVYCDPKQAEDLARLINRSLPYAEAAVSQYAAEQEAARKEWEDRLKQHDNPEKDTRTTGATARKREKERKGERLPSEQRKAMRSERDRLRRRRMGGRK
jgi:hypothetical protein